MPEVTIDYLEEERKKLWIKITEQTDILRVLDTNIQEYQNQLQEIKKIAESKISEDETVIKGIRNKVSEYKNKIIDSYNTAETTLQELQSKAQFSEKLNLSTQETFEKINSMKSDIEEKFSEIEKTYNTVIDINQNYDDEIEKCSNFVSESEEKISTIEDIKIEILKTNEIIKEIASNMQNFKTKSLERRDEIKELYNEIFGTTNEKGEEVEGLKDELDTCYEDLTKKLKFLKEDFIKLKAEKENELNEFKNLKEQEFDIIKAKIQSLLPGAMSAGLSSAYNQKRRREEKSKNKAELTFNISIMALVLISVIPVGIASILLFGLNYKVIDVINYLPKLLGLIMPIYAPIVWIALTASKKVNQSKRLIEEYAHKEAISKTYEGLSREVSNLEEEDELKEKLLNNIITTSSENPGKLLQDFNKPDYPMFEIIDKFTKLLKSVKSPDELQSIIDGIVSISKNITGVESHLQTTKTNITKHNEDEVED